MAINTIPPNGCVLENIEMRERNSLLGDVQVDPSTGEFLVLDRYFSHDYKQAGELVLVYGVQRKLTPEEFYALLNRDVESTCSADLVSDHLVEAFDHDVARHLGLRAALFAYRAPDGRIMHQHST